MICLLLGLVNDLGQLSLQGAETRCENPALKPYGDNFHSEVHRHLATQAAEPGVSLNRIVSAKLAH